MINMCDKILNGSSEDEIETILFKSDIYDAFY